MRHGGGVPALTVGQWVSLEFNLSISTKYELFSAATGQGARHVLSPEIPAVRVPFCTRGGETLVRAAWWLGGSVAVAIANDVRVQQV